MKKDTFYKVDDRRDLIIPGNKDASVQFAIEHFIVTAQNAIKSHGRFVVALSGGSTPKSIYKALVSEDKSKEINWSKVHLFWGDERPVPPEHEESNYHMAMEAGLGRLPIPTDQIHRMKAEADIENNAAEYEKKIRQTLGKNKGFDLVMLGMGDDGHTASLFPDTKALHEEKKWVVSNEVPQKNTIRMTLTFPCINSAMNIAVYVLGPSKKDMLAKILLHKEKNIDLPSSLIGTKEHKALWIADEDAAELLFHRFGLE